MKRFRIVFLSACVMIFCACVFAESESGTEIETKAETETKIDTETKTAAESVECWNAAEITFCADSEYSERAAFYEVRVDVDFVSPCGTTLRIPAFWDGGNVWRVRFAPTETGEWKYVSHCNFSTDSGLSGQSGALNCVPYSGACEIYRHGFVTTRDGLKYFIYADGTPFFYLGDTHWGMMKEEFDEPGPHVGSVKTDSHFKYVVNRRAEQGFTVFQSEPIGTTVRYSDGIDGEDVKGFQNMDRYFQHIARVGLVHANAQFFYPSEMIPIQNDDAFLELISRYWVARYSAYPVLWTLGQETDFNFYKKFPDENPYLKICHWIHTYDAYHHPITAHMENAGSTTRSGINGTHASLFQNAPGHTWYAVQWSRRFNTPMNWSVPKDFWNDGKGKVSILYESLYCNLWTKDFGARAEGWLAFLNGMYGYGYGAADLWLYKSTYDMQSTSNNDGISSVTPTDKGMYWSEALELDSARQAGYMKAFLEAHSWWKLIPEFASEKPFFRSASESVFYMAAQDLEGLYVLYFYSTPQETGSMQMLTPSAKYILTWFNPRTGETLSDSAVRTLSQPDGTLVLPQKPDENDWVLTVQKL